MTDDARPINPFTSAKKATNVLVSYRVEDVIDVMPQLSKEEAQALLSKHGAVIACVMLQSAATAVRRLAAQGEDHDQ